MKRFFIILAVLLLGCASTGSVPEGMTKEQVSTEKEAIKTMVDQLAINWNEDDFKKYYSLWDNNAEIITREGKTFRLTKAYSNQVITRFEFEKKRTGNIKHNIKWIKLANPTTASGFVERTCTTCNKGSAGKYSINFKFVKKNGQWFVKSQDTSR